jgi:AcrR family transcriptional regulator
VRRQIPEEWLDAAARVLGEVGTGGFTVERVARAAGVSRVTLHRRGVRRTELVEGLVHRAAADLRGSLLPVLASRDPADARLADGFGALCDVADRHGRVLAALYDVPERDGRGSERPSGFDFIEPFERLLLDAGEPAGTASERAELLVNAVTWTYLHLRLAHRWERPRARAAVVALALDGRRAQAAAAIVPPPSTRVPR